MERVRGFGKYDFERRAHVRLQQVAAMCRPVSSPDDQMRMNDRLAVLERDISDERQNLKLLLKLRRCLVFLRLPIEPPDLGTR